MLSVVPKAPNLGNALKATSYVVPNIAVPPKVSSPSEHKAESGYVPESFITVNKMRSALPYGIGTPRVISGVTTKQQFRFSHTDVEIPDNSSYRRKSCRDPTVPAKESSDGRKAFTYLFTAGTIAFTSVCGKTVLTKAARYFAANQDSVASGTLELDLGGVPEGRCATFSWRMKPIFVKHRTEKEIEASRSTLLSELRDPISDEERVQNPKWLICIGICTHLGCVPMANQGNYVGGFYCPCHGSHYDAAGRIRKGPAPENLEIPPYTFKDDKTIVIG